MDYSVGLNDEQKKAVLQTEGPVLIFAGAGSGKTRVITHRISHLIGVLEKYPESICAVTFTNKAAGEMRERVEKLLSLSIGKRVMIRTFHSLCLYILRRESRYIKFNNGFTIYDNTLQEALIKECMKELNFDRKQIKPNAVANSISRAKDSMIGPDLYLDKYGKDYFSDIVDSVYKLYEKKKEERCGLDLGDLIYRTVKLFQDNSNVLEYYCNLWKYLMVDEYQDTNKAQYALVRMLTTHHKNICVVGDDDQSIYSWRGADINNILSFHKDFYNAFIVKLEENYRSTPTILEAASSIIKRNTNRSIKTIYTNNPDGEKIRFDSFENESEEAEFIVNRIIHTNKKKDILFQDHAVFYRTNAQSRYFEESLRRHSIPYKIFGGFRFYDRKEIKDIIAYLNVIVNPLDSTSLVRIINTPARGIGEASINKMIQLSIENGISLFEVLGRPVPGIKKGSMNRLVELKQLLLDLQGKEEANVSPAKISRELIEKAGILHELEMEGNEESVSRIENINEFINSIEDYEKNTELPSLDEFLNNINLLTSEEDSSHLSDYVFLMTVHNSKGLEFDYVYIAGLEEGTFPHSLSLDNSDGIEEERRLLYVAITRAKKKLSLSYCRYTRKFGLVEPRLPSRFLDDIPRHNVEDQMEKKKFGVRKPSNPPLVRNFISDNISDSGRGQEFSEGKRVNHRVYGEGKILSISGNGENQKITVRFGNLEKKFLTTYTPLELID